MSETKIFTTKQIVAAHRFSNNHKPELEKDEKCGCFYCLKIFHPPEIMDWLSRNNSSDWRGTAICPYCGIDSVIAESGEFPITEAFLSAMNEYWLKIRKGSFLKGRLKPYGYL